MASMSTGIQRLLLTTYFILVMVNHKAQALDCPGDMQANTNSGSDAPVTWSTPVNSTCTPEPGSFSPGVTTVICSDGSDDSCMFRVTVTDNVDPTVTCPANMSKSASPGLLSAVVTWSTPNSDDNVGVVSGPTCQPTTGSRFIVTAMPTSVTCTVSDAAVNTGSCTFFVTIRDDRAPYFTSCPVGPLLRIIHREDLNPSQAMIRVRWEQPTAKDVSGNVMVLSSHNSNDLFPVGQTQVSYNATDSAGNTNTTGCRFAVDVRFNPPEQIFTKEASTSTNICIDVIWPRLFDDTTKEYKVSYRRFGQDARFTRSRIVPAQPTTFNQLDNICGLLPGQLYKVDVTTGPGGSGVVIASTTQWTRPPQPKSIDLAPGSQSPSSFGFTWPRVILNNLQQYRISVGGQDLGYVTKTTNKIEVDGLFPGPGHSVSVAAVVGSGTKRLEVSLVELFSTSALDQSQLLAYKYTESTIHIAWIATDNTRSPGHPYMMYIRPEHGDTPYQTVFVEQTAGTTVGKAKFTGLKPNTEYQIRLISNLGLSLSTEQKTRPGRVRNVRPTDVQLNSIIVKWDAPREGDVDNYEIYISPGTSDESTSVSGTSYEFKSLDAETEYFIKVVSILGGMKSVPQTLMVTAGVTKSHPSEPLNYPALAVGAGLGVVALALTIVIIVTYCKYRKLKARSHSDAPGYMLSIKHKGPGSSATATPGSSHGKDDHHYVNTLGSKLSKAMTRKKGTPPAPAQRPKPYGSESAAAPEYDYALPE